MKAGNAGSYFYQDGEFFVRMKITMVKYKNLCGQQKQTVRQATLEQQAYLP